MKPREGPLAGIRVLDLSRMVSGPLCGRMLADLGADVIKVEAPAGDPTRFVRPEVDGVGAYYAQMNAGKRNISLDLKAAGAPELLGRIIGHCDVLLENFRPGVLDRLGLGPAALRVAHPALVICSVSGWGQHGPWRTRPAYAPYVHAEIGMIEMTSRLRGAVSLPEVHQHADVQAALIAASSVLAALFQRSRTGEGSHIDLNMARAAVYADEWAAVELQRYDGSRKPFDSWTFVVVRLGDGTPFSLMGDPADAFPGWLALFGTEADAALLDEPRFATPEARAAHREKVVAVTEDLFRRFADEAALQPVLAQQSLAGAVCRPLADLAATEWAKTVGLTAAALPGLPVPAAPWTADNTDILVRGAAVRRGADNAQVLTELLEIGDSELAELAARGILTADARADGLDGGSAAAMTPELGAT